MTSVPTNTQVTTTVPVNTQVTVTGGSSSDAVEVVTVQSLVGGGTQGGYAPRAYAVTSISSWMQVHPYPYPPGVRLVLPTGQEVEIGVEYPDESHVYIEFPSPFTGTIILS